MPEGIDGEVVISHSIIDAEDDEVVHTEGQVMVESFWIEGDDALVMDSGMGMWSDMWTDTLFVNVSTLVPRFSSHAMLISSGFYIHPQDILSYPHHLTPNHTRSRSIHKSSSSSSRSLFRNYLHPSHSLNHGRRSEHHR